MPIPRRSGCSATSTAGRAGDPAILVVADAGYDVTRLTFLPQDLPVQLLGRVRSDRVMCLPTPPRSYNVEGGRPPRHGAVFRFDNPATWHDPQHTTTTETTSYDTAVARSWDRLHPGLTHQPGSTNRRRAPIRHISKTIKRETTLAARFGQAA
jgi:hypothetical protein